MANHRIFITFIFIISMIFAEEFKQFDKVQLGLVSETGEVLCIDVDTNGKVINKDR